MEFKFSISRGKAKDLSQLTTRSLHGGRTGGELLQARTVEPWHRAALREEREFNSRMKRMYEASITSNLNLDFVPTVTSANSELLVSLYIARGRMRTLEKDDATLNGILRSDRNNICGHDPFRLEMQVRKQADPAPNAPGGADNVEKAPEFDAAVNTRIEKAWTKWGEKCTVRQDKSWSEMCWTAVTAQKRDGSVLLRKHDDFPRTTSRFALREIENDRLQESYQGKAPNGNPIRFSIERDKYWEFPVAYWILTRHPGDSIQQLPSPEVARVWRERIPAEQIIHFNNIRTRAEQDIGFPEYHSIVQHLHLNRQFDRAHVTAAIWAQAKPFFIIRKYPTGMVYTPDPNPYANPVSPEELAGFAGGGPNTGVMGNQRGDGKGGGRDVVKAVEPATGEVLEIGQEPSLVDPKFPNEHAAAFTKSQMEMAARGSGKSYGTVSADFEKYSFSAARMALQPERDNYKVEQQHMISRFVVDVFRSWLYCEMMAGVLKELPMSRYEEFCGAAIFHAKQWPYIQPVQDVQAKILELEANLTCEQQIMAESENPGCWEDILTQRAAFQALVKKLGLNEVPDEAMPTLKKGPPGQAEPAANQAGPGPNAPGGAGKNGKGKRMEDLTVAQLLEVIEFIREGNGFGAAKNGNGNGHADFRELARNGLLPGHED